jgi:hypothetical protein
MMDVYMRANMYVTRLINLIRASGCRTAYGRPANR